ncbi:MAG: uridine phosphorylase [Clostridia bacterium]
MSCVYSKDEYHINLKKGDVGKYVILTGDPGRCEKIASYFKSPSLVGANREFVTYTGTLLGEKISVCSTGIGGPSAAIALEELIHIGSDTFIRVGTAGGMAEDVDAGSAVIATGAIRFEGTTKEYAPIEYPAVGDFYVTDALLQSAEKLNIPYHLGVVQSKDSFYGQHSPQTMPTAGSLIYNWNAWIKCGALASEMETAALFIVGAIRRVRVGSVLAVMGNQTRREKGLSDNIVKDTDYVISIAIEAMKLLIEKDKSRL